MQKTLYAKIENRFDINTIYFYKDYKNMFRADYYKSIYVLMWIINKFSIEIEIVSEYRMLLQTFFALKYKNIKSNEKKGVDEIIITNIKKS